MTRKARNSGLFLCRRDVRPALATLGGERHENRVESWGTGGSPGGGGGTNRSRPFERRGEPTGYGRPLPRRTAASSRRPGAATSLGRRSASTAHVGNGWWV